MNALVMRLEERADQAAAAGENELAALLWEAAAAVALSPDQPKPREVCVPILRNHDPSRAIGHVEVSSGGELVVSFSEEVKLSPEKACELFGGAGIRALEVDRYGDGFVLKKGTIVEFSISIEPAVSKDAELSELRRNLERLPAMAWATLRALGSPAPFDLTQSAATADYWRSEGREVVDLLRRSAVIGIVRDHSR